MTTSEPVDPWGGSPIVIALRREWPWLLLGAAVLVVGWLLARPAGLPPATLGGPALLVVLLALAVAAGAARHHPGVALTAMWVALLAHLQLGVPFLAVDAVVLWTAFATARWGSSATVWLSGLSVPAAIVPIVVWSTQWAVLPDWAVRLPVSQLYEQFGQLAGVAAAMLVGAALAVPWLAGMLLRTIESAGRSRELQAQAERSAALAGERAERERELAELRSSQAQLAHDVHDVVGHSLAVVLAQAESAQLLSDPEQVRASWRTSPPPRGPRCATSGRCWTRRATAGPVTAPPAASTPSWRTCGSPATTSARTSRACRGRCRPSWRPWRSG